MSAYEEARQRNALIRLIDTPRRRTPQTDRDIDNAIVFGEKVQNEAAAIERRFNVGFEWDGGRVFTDWETVLNGSDGGSYSIPAFEYQGLVSLEAPALRMLVSKTGAGRKVLTGTVGSRTTAGMPKVLKLDDSFVTFNSTMRGVLGVVVKRTFASLADLELAIEKCGVQKPTVIVAHMHAEGCPVVDPHLFFVLPKSVAFTKKGHVKAKRAFLMAHRSLTYALKPIGATTQGLRKDAVFKNPLSPMWLRRVSSTFYQLGPTSEKYPFADLTAGLPRDITDEMLWGTPTAPVEADDFRGALRRAACREVLNWFSDRNEAGFRAAVREIARKLSVTFGEDIVQALSDASSTCSWVWANHKPSKAVRYVRLGPASALTAGVVSLSERQAIGGRFGAQRRRDKNIAKMADAWIALVGHADIAPSKKLLAEKSGLSEKTVTRRWEEVLQTVLERRKQAPQSSDKQSPGYRGQATPTRRNYSATSKHPQPTAPQGLRHPPGETKPPSGRPQYDDFRQAA